MTLLFAVTGASQREPCATDVVTSVEALERVLEGASAEGVALWDVWTCPDDGHFGHERRATWAPNDCGDAGSLQGRVTTAMLEAATWEFTRGDCWVLAHVAARRYGLMAATVVHLDVSDPTEPDHLLLDLGDGRYLDVHGVSTEDEVLARLRPGGVIAPVRLDADGVAALWDRLYAEPDHAFSDKLSCGIGAEAEAMLAMCLDEVVGAVMADIPTPMP